MTTFWVLAGGFVLGIIAGIGWGYAAGIQKGVASVVGSGPGGLGPDPHSRWVPLGLERDSRWKPELVD